MRGDRLKKKNVYRMVSLALLGASALCGLLFARAYLAAQKEMAGYADLQKDFATVTPGAGQEQGDGDMAPESATDALPYVSADFTALLLENPDTVGWLAIPGTPVCYPVVQAEDNETYLGADFHGRPSSAGALFTDRGNDLRALDDVTVIYGHNMGAGRQDMFSSLPAYKDYGYFTEHKYIQFATIHARHGWWEVFAVIEYDISAGGFDCTLFNFDDDDAFVDWITQAKALSLHGSGTSVEPGSHVLALSTCDRGRYGQNGRLLVLAVKMDEGG